ncbi:transcription factor WhiB [Rhodococcus koreensis]|uniref:Transcriptional regulator WhiB n=1 Tax=Rhodococcus koreensis TaxID=99653 RepID=A0A1H4P299_9NOCA|nr:transcription factor WhiB [Rhodococcus koreensis]
MPNEQLESETRWSTVSDEPQTNSEAGAADGVCVQEVCVQEDGVQQISVQESSVKEIPVPELVAQEVETAGPRPVLSLVTGFDELFDTIEDQWQERALCAQTDPEAFFPEKGGSTREAKRICLGCEVRDECLDYALANDERFGIWGGLSERERRRLKRGIV